MLMQGDAGPAFVMATIGWRGYKTTKGAPVTGPTPSLGRV